MAKFIDLTGERIEKWLVEGLWEPGQTVYWRCRCDCGTVKRVLGDNLRSGKSQSCGCLRLEIMTKHGMVDHPAYANCKWSSAVEQSNNRRDNILINTPEGKMTILQASRKFGINPKTLTARVRA